MAGAAVVGTSGRDCGGGGALSGRGLAVLSGDDLKAEAAAELDAEAEAVDFSAPGTADFIAPELRDPAVLRVLDEEVARLLFSARIIFSMRWLRVSLLNPPSRQLARRWFPSRERLGMGR
jgi:hypothetical protein